MGNKSIKKNSIYNAIKTLSSILFPLITFPYVSRVLLTDNVGKINFGLSIVSYFSLIATLGITTYAVRECSKVRDDYKKLSDIASQIYSINIITTIIAYISLFFTLLLYHKLEGYRGLIAVQSLVILTTTLGADWLNTAMEDLKFITIRTLGFQILSLLLMFALVHKPEDYMIYAVICVVSTAGASVINIWYRKRYCELRITWTIEWKKHINPILLLFVMILAQTIFSNLDISMIGLFKGDNEVGIYSTAHKIMNLVNQVVASLCWVIMPRMSYYFENGDYNSINRLLRKVASFNITVGLPCVVGIIMLSKDIIIIFAGTSFLNASGVLRILMIAYLFMLIGGNFLGNAVLLPARQENIFMVVCVVSSVINALLNYFVIPLYGAKGAAMTTVLSEALIFLLLYLKKDKRIRITEIHKIVIIPILGCILIVGICFACYCISNIWIRVVLSVSLSCIAYFLVQIIMGNELVVDLLNEIKKRFSEVFKMEG